ncbi:acyl-homoserine-lactone synthase [Vitiosangium sp. GDMCC 1.1324]|uniref:acyl-homoserine-lactone synthase n=1 Tax=Vitiosangium sp. (strain GDMCC 1.1324) TaxID=2138576 RepID=UPI000D3D6248|nr:acyl-homoserine-lactone synthase [Vitiosangium sp. GDMCC 1.1324]PTL81866.1 autoinducer synthesis protein [Vitiosangium sp. GDMCC 1.1324]
MFKIHVIHAGNRHHYEEALEQHHRIRHDIYVGERKWMELERPDGREIDQFDTDKAVYLLGIEPGRGVVGGSRLVPTLGPNLMSDVFPELANVRGLPRAYDIFEWTRIFIIPAKRESGRLSQAAGIVYCGILEFCLSQHIRQLSVVCEDYWIPRLQALGWSPVRLGEAILKDDMSIVGITCDMTEEALAKTRSTYSIDDSVMAPEFVPNELLMLDFNSCQ